MEIYVCDMETAMKARHTVVPILISDDEPENYNGLRYSELYKITAEGLASLNRPQTIAILHMLSDGRDIALIFNGADDNEEHKNMIIAWIEADDYYKVKELLL